MTPTPGNPMRVPPKCSTRSAGTGSATSGGPGAMIESVAGGPMKASTGPVLIAAGATVAAGAAAVDRSTRNRQSGSLSRAIGTRIVRPSSERLSVTVSLDRPITDARTRNWPSALVQIRSSAATIEASEQHVDSQAATCKRRSLTRLGGVDMETFLGVVLANPQSDLRLWTAAVVSLVRECSPVENVWGSRWTLEPKGNGQFISSHPQTLLVGYGNPPVRTRSIRIDRADETAE